MIWLLLALAQEAPKNEFKVGVVNLRHCFDRTKYERIQEVDAELQKTLHLHMKAVEDVAARIEKLKSELSGLTPEMSIYWDKLGMLKQAETDLEFKRKYGRQHYLNRANQLQVQVYNEIRRVVAMYGKDRGYALILRVEEPALESDDGAPTAAAQIQARVVLHHAEGIDVTRDILRILNEEYAKEKAARKP